MKTSPLIALSAFLFQAQACVRVRVDRYINNEGLSVIQDVKLYDNDSPVKTAAGPQQFTPPFPETVKVDDYYVQLQYKDGKHHPYGGRIQYPRGRKFPSRFFSHLLDLCVVEKC
jgi:hypothetical protein